MFSYSGDKEFVQARAPGRAAHAAGARRTAVASVSRFIVVLACVWIALNGLYRALPMIRPGSDIVAHAKFDVLLKQRLFGADDKVRVLVFGDSKTMSGFRPDVFDPAMGAGVRSYNLGLPGELRFLPILKAALASGNIPTHILLAVPWDAAGHAPTLLEGLRDDAAVLERLIPFRELPRDAVAFVATSRFHFSEKYRQAGAERGRMLDDRGWYFIKSQALYPDQRLPADYLLPSDWPTLGQPRAVPEDSFAKRELMALARRYSFKVILVPANMRHRAVAPAPAQDARRNQAIGSNPVVRVLGPDYWIYPPADYGDPVHLNPDGAAVYTRDLARLLKETGGLD